MKRLILSLCLLALLPLPAFAGMEFIPDNCDGVLAFRPAVALDPAVVADKAERARLEAILAEISAAVGFDLRKDVDVAGYCLVRAGQFLEGGRPHGALFATGRLDPKALLAKAGDPEPRKVADLDVYPLGDGVVFGLIGRETALLGGVEETSAALMAAKKSALSGAARFQELARRAADPGTAFALSLRVDAQVAAALRKLAGAEWNPEPLLAGLASLELSAGKDGARLALVGGSPAYAGAAKGAAEALLAKASAAALAESLRAKALPEADPGRAEAVAGAALAQAFFANARLSVEGASLLLAVPAASIEGAGGQLASTLLRTFGRNYEIGRGADGERKCLGNMQVLEGARDLAELEKKGDPGELTPEALVKLGYLGKPPVCPKAGVYGMSRDEQKVLRIKCSVHGDMDEIHDKLFNPANVK